MNFGSCSGDCGIYLLKLLEMYMNFYVVIIYFGVQCWYRYLCKVDKCFC